MTAENIDSNYKTVAYAYALAAAFSEELEGECNLLEMPLDKDSLQNLINYVEAFVNKNGDAVEQYLETIQTHFDQPDSFSRTQYSPYESLGHDLFYSSNGHGTGFFERTEVPKYVREALQHSASENFSNEGGEGAFLQDKKLYVDVIKSPRPTLRQTAPAKTPSQTKPSQNKNLSQEN